MGREEREVGLFFRGGARKLPKGAQVLIVDIGALRLKICAYSSMQWCAAVGVSVSRVTWNSVPVLIGAVASGLWRCGTVSVSFRSVRGRVVVPSRFIFRVGTTSLLVCARTLAELVGAWQPSFQKSSVFQVCFRVFQSFYMQSSS